MCKVTEEPTVLSFGDSAHSSAEWRLLATSLSAAYEDEFAVPVSIGSPNDAISSEAQAAIKVALNEIAKTDPASFREFEALVSHVVLVASPNIVEGTAVNSLGCIYLLAESTEMTWVHYAEMLLHEIAHQIIYAHWTLEALILNDRKELFDSPFRTDKRPLSGIFHAMCVLARLIRFRRVYSEKGTLKDDFGRFYALSNHDLVGRDQLEEAFDKSRRIIAEHADLSPVGTEIFEASCAMASNSRLEKAHFELSKEIDPSGL
jgi:HEXXH motif-containing protein